MGEGTHCTIDFILRLLEIHSTSMPSFLDACSQVENKFEVPDYLVLFPPMVQSAHF
jgi:hypothetical protein